MNVEKMENIEIMKRILVESRFGYKINLKEKPIDIITERRDIDDFKYDNNYLWEFIFEDDKPRGTSLIVSVIKNDYYLMKRCGCVSPVVILIEKEEVKKWIEIVKNRGYFNSMMKKRRIMLKNTEDLIDGST